MRDGICLTSSLSIWRHHAWGLWVECAAAVQERRMQRFVSQGACGETSGRAQVGGLLVDEGGVEHGDVVAQADQPVRLRPLHHTRHAVVPGAARLLLSGANEGKVHS